jgi:excisionase family DNA binding protein
VSAVGIERHYTTAELAKLLSVHPETIRRAAARGDLRSVRIGRDRRYPHGAVLDWLQLLGERAAA